MRNILVVTGGAGFIGSNLIEELIKFKKFKIISLDNYEAGTSKNHILNRRVNYLKGDTIDFFKHFNKVKKKIISIDNYSTGIKNNHVNSKRVTYLKEDTLNFKSSEIKLDPINPAPPVTTNIFFIKI